MINVKTRLLSALLCLSGITVSAESAVEYNNTIVRELIPAQAATAAYLDAATHGRNVPEANAKLALMVHALETARTHLQAIKPYKGYTGLRDSILSYVELGYTSAAGFSGILTDEQMSALSYEKMKEYMETSDVLNDRLIAFGAMIRREQKRFADKNGFEIEKEQNPMQEKFKQVQKVFRYYHQVFLIFFKCNKLENSFVEGLTIAKAESLEQTRIQYQQAAEEGLKKLESLPPFDSDPTLGTAGKEALQFFESEAKDKFPPLIGHFQKKEKLDKQAAAINKLAEKDRTDKMIDSYNANIKAVNEAIAVYNTTNQELNAKREAVIDRFNKTVVDFLDRNSPKMK